MGNNDRGSLESGPGSRLGDWGHRQEAWLEHGLGAEGHPQSVQRCMAGHLDDEEGALVKEIDFFTRFTS